MFSMSSTTVRLLAGTTLVAATVLSVGAPALAGSPTTHRIHRTHRPAPAATSVAIGTAIAYVRGPDGNPVATAPSALP